MHGAINQAGKVRNKTIKVAKQEKKKPVTGTPPLPARPALFPLFLVGRAKKRMLYNRRFKTAVVGFGKRGMNPQAK